MGVYIRNGIYWYSFKLKRQKRVYHSADVPVDGTRRAFLEAEGIFRAARDAAKSGKVKKEPARITVRELLAWYLETPFFRKVRSPDSVKLCVRLVNDFMGEKIACNIDPMDIELLREHLAATGRFGFRRASTVNRLIVPLSAAYQHARRSKELNFIDNPFESITPHDEENFKRERVPSETEIDVMWNAFSPFYKRVLIFDLATGLRQGELRNLKWSDLNLDNRIAKVWGGKEGKYKKVGLNSDAMKVLVELLHEKVNSEFVFTYDGKPLTRCGILRSEWDRVTKKKLKIKNLQWRDMRHAFASYLEMDSNDEKAVSRMMGHASGNGARAGKMTDRYIQLDEKRILGAVSKMRSHLARVSNDSPRKCDISVTILNIKKSFSVN